MATFTSTRTILKVEGLNAQTLTGTTLAAGTQLTAVTLTSIDQLDPALPLGAQEVDADGLTGETFVSFLGGASVSNVPAEPATLLIDGVEVAQRVPDLHLIEPDGAGGLDVQTDGGQIARPLFFEIDGTIFIVSADAGVDLSGVTELTSAITIGAESFNEEIAVDTTNFAPDPGDDDPVDPDPVDPDPVDPAPTPINEINGTDGSDFLSGTRAADEINGGGGRDDLFGRGGDDILNGGDGRDELRGGGGDDVLNGGRGNDLLIGGRGADTFLFQTGDGDDVIRGFGADDVVDLSDIASLTGFADVQNALTQTGSSAVLDLGNGDSVLFLRTSVDSFVADDFTF
ncbi:calcium-binding protein [Dinoroseobacter sp. S76]|uniref:calcium-binding protein n=1 Tax=Dinoroseobacter sp. S76 TaxID=3415124 RepID=UPI003C7A925F